MSLSTLNASKSKQIAEQHKLRIGDILKISRPCHNHYAVFIGVFRAEDNETECFGGDPMVVHVSSEDPSGGDINPSILLFGDGNGKIKPRLARLHELIGTNNWSVDTSWDEQGIKRFSPKDVKIRAEQAVDHVEGYLFDLAQAHSDAEQNCCQQIQLEEGNNESIPAGKYCLYLSNCEHFARWCVYGFGDSSQSRIALSILFGSFAGIITAISRREAIKAAIVGTASFTSAILPPVGIGLVVGGLSYLGMEKYAQYRRKEDNKKTFEERRAIYDDWTKKNPEKTSAAVGAICGRIAITFIAMNNSNNDPTEMVEMAVNGLSHMAVE